MSKKKTKKLPDAIEAARALVKVNSKSPVTKAPIQFDRCDDDPIDHVAPAKRRGRTRPVNGNSRQSRSRRRMGVGEFERITKVRSLDHGFKRDPSFFVSPD